MKDTDLEKRLEQEFLEASNLCRLEEVANKAKEKLRQLGYSGIQPKITPGTAKNSR